ncbi:MAG TPA: anti-sigma factor [Candidatus Sulfotelmatobacter sp.]|nr:anti-sigma factor [Candidatus Sulfotelmatobacter sp.]
MNCVELRESLAEVEDGSTLEQRTHLRTCQECSELLEELNLIVETAGELQASDEPSPRVWNSIEIALRREGLIRPQNPGRRPAVPSFSARWGAARWLVPAAAMLLLAVGIYERHESLPNQTRPEAAVVTPAVNLSGLNDEDFIQEVAANAPAMQGQYEENLRRVNESIRDAESMVKENPNDEDARRSLMDAYQQKSMLFEMAMDQPTP